MKFNNLNTINGSKGMKFSLELSVKIEKSLVHDHFLEQPLFFLADFSNQM